MLWRGAALEGLDDDHTAAAAGAGMRECLGVAGICAAGISGLLWSLGTASNSRARAMLSARERQANRP